MVGIVKLIDEKLDFESSRNIAKLIMVSILCMIIGVLWDQGYISVHTLKYTTPN